MTSVDDVVDDTTVEETKMEGSQSQEVDSAAGVEARQSRKREREVSLEPGTPQATTTDIDSGHSESKDRRKPAKKNRVSVQLDAATEEEEPEADEGGENATASQSVSGSPPHETKIRQISQGVEDITWKNMPKHPTPEPEHAEGGAKHEPMDTEHDQEIPQDTQAEAKIAEQPLFVPGENLSAAMDDGGAKEYSGEADPAEVPPDAHNDEPSQQPSTTHHEGQKTPSTPPPREASPMFVSPMPDAKPRRGSDSSTEENGLKRKMGDRTVSETKVPEDLVKNGETQHATATKRPRDDPDADENPRQNKRPTPPPDKDNKAEASSEASSETSTTAPSSSGAKLSGFSAYASTSSPFASVKGPSLFSTKSSPWASSSTSSFPSGSSSPKPTGGNSLLGSSALFNSINSKPVFTPSPTPAKPESSLKRTGFEAFASSSSPFATAAKRSKSPPPGSPTPPVYGHRSKSPVHAHHTSRATNVNPFSAYATGGAHAFTTPKRGSPALGDVGDSAIGPSATGNGETSASAGSEDEGAKDKGEFSAGKEATFSARLRAQKDEEEESESEKKLNLTEQELHTGEEDEDTVYQVRGKLYSLSDGNTWKERGTGQLKLNVPRDDSSGARLLMRKEAVYTVILNMPLFKGMKCFLAPSDPRYLRFSGLEKGTVTHYNLRVSNAKIAAELLEELNMHIPSE